MKTNNHLFIQNVFPGWIDTFVSAAAYRVPQSSNKANTIGSTGLTHTKNLEFIFGSRNKGENSKKKAENLSED